MFIDKMPINFDFLPRIISAIPEAKFILTDRSLEPHIFSIFKSEFTVANYYCSDLKDIYDYKCFYQKEKEYFLNNYGSKVFEFNLCQFQESHLK